VLHLAHQFCASCIDGNDADSVATPPAPFADLGDGRPGCGDDTNCSNFSTIGFDVLYPPCPDSGSGGGSLEWRDWLTTTLNGDWLRSFTSFPMKLLLFVTKFGATKPLLSIVGACSRSACIVAGNINNPEVEVLACLAVDVMSRAVREADVTSDSVSDGAMPATSDGEDDEMAGDGDGGVVGPSGALSTRWNALRHGARAALTPTNLLNSPPALNI